MMLAPKLDADDADIYIEEGRYYLTGSGEQLDLTRPIDIYQDHGLVTVHGSHVRVGLSLAQAMWLACDAHVKIALPDGRTYHLAWGNYRLNGEPETPAIF